MIIYQSGWIIRRGLGMKGTETRNEGVGQGGPGLKGCRRGSKGCGNLE